MDDQATVTTDEQGRGVRRRLGRGLNALLGGGEHESGQAAHEAVAEAGEAGGVQVVRNIAPDQIDRNPFQPRKDFDKQTLLELAESMITHGVLQPLLVRPAGSRFQLIAGERRWLAAKEAGMDSVPCRVLELEDKAVCEVAIVENVQRKDLSDLEKAQAFQDYLDKFGGTVADLAKQLGMNRSTVTNFIRLLGLPESVKKALAAGKISNGHARALCTLDEADQLELCQRIQRDSLSVRKTEEAVKLIQNGGQGGGRPDGQPGQPAGQPDDDQPATVPFPQEQAADSQPPQGSQQHEGGGQDEHRTNHIVSLEAQLRETLGTKVEIKVTDKDAGRITVHFGSNDEFERLVKALRRAAPSHDHGHQEQHEHHEHGEHHHEHHEHQHAA